MFFHSRRGNINLSHWNKGQSVEREYTSHFYQRALVTVLSSWASCQRIWRNSVLDDGNFKNAPTEPRQLLQLTSLHLVWFPQILTGCFLQTGGPKVEHIDFVGDIVWYYPVALALNSCMVPIGVPASMRTRTQTVNHLCIFQINSSAAFMASVLQMVYLVFCKLLSCFVSSVVTFLFN